MVHNFTTVNSANVKGLGDALNRQFVVVVVVAVVDIVMPPPPSRREPCPPPVRHVSNWMWRSIVKMVTGNPADFGSLFGWNSFGQGVFGSMAAASPCPPRRWRTRQASSWRWALMPRRNAFKSNWQLNSRPRAARLPGRGIAGIINVCIKNPASRSWRAGELLTQSYVISAWWRRALAPVTQGDRRWWNNQTNPPPETPPARNQW